jgi:hypothetical protein
VAGALASGTVAGAVASGPVGEVTHHHLPPIPSFASLYLRATFFCYCIFRFPFVPAASGII